MHGVSEGIKEEREGKRLGRDHQKFCPIPIGRGFKILKKFGTIEFSEGLLFPSFFFLLLINTPFLS
jgi:hypothetical protein